jgi:adenine phosphoribosyltransferase
MATQVDMLKGLIRDIPDWPKKGILFRDITPLLADALAFNTAINLLVQPFLDKKIDYVASVEARGFIFGVAVAQKLGAGIIPIRKKGKLPHHTHTEEYDLEYGTDTLQVHRDAAASGASVLLVDDLLATGGTTAAAIRLLNKIPAKVVGVSFLIELAALKGRARLGECDIHSVISYR